MEAVADEAVDRTGLNHAFKDCDQMRLLRWVWMVEFYY